jgi:23S rRNA (cytidine1920-2'-O)/16S rRNA (cytidine1409-2'-O)-methyltransferase
MKKLRLDELVVDQGLAENLDIARRLIMAGEIRTGDRVWDKAGDKIPIDTELELKSKHCKWVSKGGLKLEKAINDFSLNPSGTRCLDIGASTGGFTDVLLQNGAAEVVALDVGQGLLDPKVANDPRVIIKDKTNFKLLQPGDLGEPFDIIVTDVSFISLTKILPNAVPMMKENAYIVALIKPQFEAERHQVPEGGIITDPELQISIVEKLIEALSESKLYLHAMSPVPLVNRRKNIEFVSLWKKYQPSSLPDVWQIVYDSHNR